MSKELPKQYILKQPIEIEFDVDSGYDVEFRLEPLNGELYGKQRWFDALFVELNVEQLTKQIKELVVKAQERTHADDVEAWHRKYEQDADKITKSILALLSIKETEQ